MVIGQVVTMINLFVQTMTRWCDDDVLVWCSNGKMWNGSWNRNVSKIGELFAYDELDVSFI